MGNEKERESKGSTRKGNQAKKAPAHRNKFQFTAGFNKSTSRLTKRINDLPATSGLCRKCTNIIEWRKQYRKYKMQKTNSKCGWCEQKTVRLAYHVICRPCANTKEVCCKCLVKLVEEEKGGEVRAMTAKEVEFALDHSLVKERQKRSIMRRHEQGTIDDDEINKLISRANAGTGNEEAVADDDGDDAEGDADDSDDIDDDDFDEDSVPQLVATSSCNSSSNKGGITSNKFPSNPIRNRKPPNIKSAPASSMEE